MHQAQAGVHGMAMTSKAEDLNYLSDAARRNLAVFQQVVSLIAYLIVFCGILKIGALFKATVLPLWEVI